MGSRPSSDERTKWRFGFVQIFSRLSVEILQCRRKITKMFNNKFSEDFPVSLFLIAAKFSSGNGQIVVINTDGNSKWKKRSAL
jgi:hypothetical protein